MRLPHPHAACPRRPHRQLRQNLVQTMSLSRVSAVLRSDALEADSATLEEASRLILTFPNGRTVTYDIETSRLVRRVRKGDDIQHRESYGLPKNAVVSL